MDVGQVHRIPALDEPAAGTALIFQLGTSVESPEARRESVVALVAEAGPADLIVLPELWVNGYHSFGSYRQDAESLDGPTMDCLRSMATQKNAFVVGGTFLERVGSDIYNTAVVLDPDGDVVHTYRKAHLMSYRSSERALLTPGRSASVVNTPLGRLGVAICYDVRFPELFRSMVDQGAEIFIVPAAWPAERVASWQLFLQARAAENQAYVLGCNSVGHDHGVMLGGHSLSVDPLGCVSVRAGAEPTVIRTTIELGKVREFRAVFPALAHRRDWTSAAAGTDIRRTDSGRPPAVR